MPDINDLAQRLEGCHHANVERLGEEYFTVDFLEHSAGGMMHALRMAEGVGPITYHPSELDKCVIHYCVRNLIQDLWEFGIPRIKRFVDSNGRFDLEKALASGDYGNLSDELAHNLDVGREVVYGITSKVYDDWVQNLKQRNQLSRTEDPIPLTYTVYKLHSVLISGGDWQAPSIMDATFTSAGRENFDWLVDYPNLSRQELEVITENSIEEGIKQASQLAIKSTAKEQVVRDVTKRGDMAYVLDPQAKKIILNPKYLPDVERMEAKTREDGFFDETQLLLMCPAKFVPSTLYNGGGMLHDLIRFRSSVFVEIYLATYNRR
ncbi:MAG: hypothetical protein AABX34_02510 [Nanoarchaeota archaeon]